MKHLLSSAFLILISISLYASHIIGGELVCTKTAAETYEVKLILYRDCTSMTMFDNPAYFTVFNTATNAYISNFPVYDPVIEEIDIDSICYDTLPEICVERAIYTTTITLADLADGYTLVYQRCCRNSSIINITDPDNTGFTVFQNIPGTAVVSDNNSPVFNDYPPIVICIGEALYIDNSATDPDGDSLVYSFFAPLLGADPFAPAPAIASPPPYEVVTNTPGYSPEYPIDASPALEINSVTGLITGTATTEGRYVVGIKVSEYREGILLTDHYRDFQFNVQDCSSGYVADIEEKISSCGNRQIHFHNFSEGTDTYLWDFGDGTTSTETEPIHTYLDYGTYYVKMIAQPGETCEDPSYSVVTLLVSPFVATVSFDGTELIASDGATFQWYLNGEIITGATEQTYTPVEEGNYSVTITNEEGCSDMSTETFVAITDIKNNLFGASILVYPNPSTGDFNIDFTNALNSAAEIEIYNSLGELIQSEKASVSTMQFHLEKSGIYLLIIKDGGSIDFRKIVVN